MPNATFVVMSFISQHATYPRNAHSSKIHPSPSPCLFGRIITMSWGSCVDSFCTRLFYVVFYSQEELFVLTCARCALPLLESRVEPLAEAVVYERSREGKPTCPSKALHPTGRSCDRCDGREMIRANPLGPLRVFRSNVDTLTTKAS